MAKKEKKVEINVGQNVFFAQSGGAKSLAFVTRVLDDEKGIVNLYVIRDDAVRGTNFESGVLYSDDKETGTWHFIEKE